MSDTVMQMTCGIQRFTGEDNKLRVHHYFNLIDQKVSFAKMYTNQTEHNFEIKYKKGLNKIKQNIGMYSLIDTLHQRKNLIQNSEDFGMLEMNANSTTVFESEGMQSIGGKI